MPACGAFHTGEYHHPALALAVAAHVVRAAPQRSGAFVAGRSCSIEALSLHARKEASPMNHQLDQALLFRAEGRHVESLDLLLALHAATPNDPQINYQCAWAHDVLGRESAAVPYYERAIQLGLAGDDLRGALLGLGSTYRCLGLYEQSARTLRRGIESFPQDRAFEVFLAMSLYNLNQPGLAMELLLRHLAETTQDESILLYRRAILFYADKLDQIWL